MQFSLLTVLACASALAAAAPQDLPATVAPGPFRAEKRACTYMTADYLSSCTQGETLFCTGNTNACPSGKTDTQDASSTKKNEQACSGKAKLDNCMQTIACC